MRLLLNAKPYLHSTRLQTWGDWLHGLDADTPRAGRIVTAVRFDGVDEPAFRAAEVQDRRLDAFDSVEVETAAPRALVARTLQDGAVMTASLADAAAAVGERFRQRDLHDAHAMLPGLVDGIRSVVTLTDACASALGLRREMITCHGTAFDQWMGEFGRRLAVLLQAQADKDWVTVADSLEYELEPALREWASVFEQLATTAASSS